MANDELLLRVPFYAVWQLIVLISWAASFLMLLIARKPAAYLLVLLPVWGLMLAPGLWLGDWQVLAGGYAAGVALWLGLVIWCAVQLRRDPSPPWRMVLGGQAVALIALIATAFSIVHEYQENRMRFALAHIGAGAVGDRLRARVSVAGGLPSDELKAMLHGNATQRFNAACMIRMAGDESLSADVADALSRETEPMVQQELQSTVATLKWFATQQAAPPPAYSNFQDVTESKDLAALSDANKFFMMLKLAPDSISDADVEKLLSWAKQGHCVYVYDCQLAARFGFTAAPVMRDATAQLALPSQQAGTPMVLVVAQPVGTHPAVQGLSSFTICALLYPDGSIPAVASGPDVVPLLVTADTKHILAALRTVGKGCIVFKPLVVTDATGSRFNSQLESWFLSRSH